MEPVFEWDLKTGTLLVKGKDEDFCKCRNCDSSGFCCRRSEQISFLRGETVCIIKQESFESVVLNLDTLSTARHLILTLVKSEEYRNSIRNRNNRVWRHLAYKQFVAWVNSWSPTREKNPSSSIPKCVLRKIRQTFPDPNGIYDPQLVNGEFFD